MRIVVFSDDNTFAQSAYQAIKGKTLHAEFYSLNQIKVKLKCVHDNELVYVDVGKMTEDERKRIIAFLSRVVKKRYGIIDPNATIADPAELFYRGACDYLGKDFIKTGLQTNRIKKAMQFSKSFQNLDGNSAVARNKEGLFPSGNNWKLIRSGREYTFWFLFVGLDNLNSVKESMSISQCKQLSKTFKKYIASMVLQGNGKVWMWNDYSGLIIFPFDGASGSPFEASFRLFLNRKIFWIDWDIPHSITYHMALHIGNTIYRQHGETGTIISDTINKIFHLGGKHITAGSFYLSKEAVQFVPKRTLPYFAAAGTYETMELFQMKSD